MSKPINIIMYICKMQSKALLQQQGHREEISRVSENP